MKMHKYTRALLLLIAALTLAGCANMKTNLVRTTVAFNETTAHATQLYNTDVIDQATAREMTPIIDQGSRALDAAWTAYLLGKPDNAAQAIATVNALLIKLTGITKQETAQ